MIIETFKNGHLPAEVEERLTNLIPTAERLTAASSGFNGHTNVADPYGGFHATNAYTGSTFTLKSVVATVCGIAPLVVDFNREYLHHIYQPCMPHILEALNSQTRSKTENYTSWPWRSTWMQSVTEKYDNQGLLTPALGFKHKVTDINITEDRAKQGGRQPQKFNFWGYPETELADYYRNAINSAKKRKERLFISHLTGITHQPWDTPNHKYEEMISHGWVERTNKRKWEYEGQSMIGPTFARKDGKQDWQFSVMNTGGTWLALRSAAKPYRLIIPVIPSLEWRFSNVKTDPHELEPLQEFGLKNFLDMVLPEYGEDAVQWVNEAAHVAKWWVKENWRRYEYVP
ncbi:unnamed protein product [Penicillium nalgiovense]|uniref:Uncharacterized protein n=1 Tax=Penicillium nalgiovense TaxID=60175 RepID=A0A9W4MQP0_PENNA|nr:unnamed protein product [Penicillium nalgiovense]CAG8016791.1 unnamed protein product [Penicillium nalgiovense]CAG8025326.1 unnamed protein product [Penicillium nalgiovense]CAG8036071.1 unnamed protein product [Penicillium nalgiovense]CAG8037785.1 unnamed protein product [Penicillium nalgiovense]